MSSTILGGGSDGNYWSSSLEAEYGEEAYYLTFYSTYVKPADSNRNYGYSLRLVK